MRPACTATYYKHSTSIFARGWRRLAATPRALALGLALLAGCGASNNQIAKSAPRLAIAHLSSLPPAERAKALGSLPLILEIRKGDSFPVEPLLESRLVALHTEGTWTVEARETFYVLLREEGAPVISLDGVDFDDQTRNSFGVGFDSQAAQAAKLRVALRWHAEPGGAAPR
jgi:hypothetical protein